MAEYKTPGVFVEEISTFPTSVVRVATAVPVFIGYTQTTPDGLLKATKVRSLVEYEHLFGGEPPDEDSGRRLKVQLDGSYNITSVTVELKYYLYQSLRFFYANGGGDAYILPVGTYTSFGFASAGPDSGVLSNAIAVLERLDEATLLLCPDGFAFVDPSDLADFQREMLIHCGKMKDRFTILDLLHDLVYALPDVVQNDSDAFRDRIGLQFLKYGAAYYPELHSTLGPNAEIGLTSFQLNSGALTVGALGAAINDTAIIGWTAANGDVLNVPDDATYALIETTYTGYAPPAVGADLGTRMALIKGIVDMIYNFEYTTPLTNVLVDELVGRIADGSTSPLALLVQKMIDYDDGYPVGGALGIVFPGDYPDYGLSVTPGTPAIYGPGPYSEPATPLLAESAFDDLFEEAYGYLGQIRDMVNTIASGADLFTTSRKLAEIRDAIRNTGYTLPPSGAIAGIYAVNDANLGVWHSPANMSLNAVREVARRLHSSELDDLNIPNAGNGKSINAIRFFRGQGVLVYGARTLAGNDNEWRYVSVRRFFNMVEESVKKASEPYVFEPNDANTWIKVKGMIENFLSGLWRDGALAGAVPKDAFFVKVGLGQTMTAQDILEGKMIVEIGMAAVRPAEFVILKFMHKMQES